MLSQHSRHYPPQPLHFSFHLKLTVFSPQTLLFCGFSHFLWWDNLVRITDICMTLTNCDSGASIYNLHTSHQVGTQERGRDYNIQKVTWREENCIKSLEYLTLTVLLCFLFFSIVTIFLKEILN